MSLLWSLEKPFDKVPHNGLLYKLLKCGIDYITLQWLKRYLEKRRQSVALEGEHSHSVPVTGVPQGSGLRLLMFLTFINDLPCYVRSRVGNFADDKVIYLLIESESFAGNLQDDLHSLEKWGCHWRYTGNTQTCFFQISVQTSSQGPRSS